MLVSCVQANYYLIQHVLVNDQDQDIAIHVDVYGIFLMQYNKNILDELHHIALFEALEDYQLEQILTTSYKISLSTKTILFEK